MNLMQGDCLELMKGIPDGSVNLVLTDPPYNIGVTTNVSGKAVVNAWDKIDGYVDWCVEWLTLCSKKLKPNGVLYFWHNDMGQIAELLMEIRKRTPLVFVSFCIWDKGDTYRAHTWHQRDSKSRTALRSWVNTCEYCLHFFNAPADADKAWAHTGLNRVYSNPACFKPLKEWYQRECERLGLDNKKIGAYYEKATGKNRICCGIIFRIASLRYLRRKCGRAYTSRSALARATRAYGRNTRAYEITTAAMICTAISGTAHRCPRLTGCTPARSRLISPKGLSGYHARRAGRCSTASWALAPPE